ncbi:hypothetical protein MG296_12655 [Flavobacteriaceae bacterium TK19130]|nr:hypothetical protein [Thermobacterium salinum]
MKRYQRILSIFLLLFIWQQSRAQQTQQGQVSFVTSQNVYVKFDNTEVIKVGDTLRIGADNKPCLLVDDKSSTSAVCTVINDCTVAKGDEVVHTTKKSTQAKDVNVVETPQPTRPKPPKSTSQEAKESSGPFQEKIRGRISASSYNQFSDVREDRHRIMSRFSMTADNIGDSRFSTEAYLNYRNVILPEDSNFTGRTSMLNVFNLSVRYDIDTTFTATLGRKVNPKAPSLGANDGLQLEKYFGNFYVGAMGGFRPDFFDFGFNSDLLQYGGYLGIETKGDDTYSQTTVGVMQQTNNGATDRMYTYLQHNSFIGDLNLFGSMELDLYGNQGSETRLTNMYVSARYRFSRAFDLMVSYDTRKRVIFYETFKTEIEQLLDDDFARQGVRIRANIRPLKYVRFGGSYATRFQENDLNKSDNINGYISWSKIPAIDGRFNFNYNRNESNYLESSILSFRYSREIIDRKLDGELYYRMADYTYASSTQERQQSYYGASISWNISRTWLFSVNGELSQFEEENNYRFYTRLIKRFYSK